jgi:hypothetical protein
VEVRAADDALEILGNGWKRTVRLAGNALTVEQTASLPADGLTPERRGNTSLDIERVSERQTVYTLK